MGKPHPSQLRARVVAFVEDGHSNRAAAAHFRVSPRFVNNMVLLKRETGALDARRQGRPTGSGKLGDHRAWVMRRISENGDLTLDELCVELAGRGLQVHRSSVGRLLHRLSLSHKKVWLQATSAGPISRRPAPFGSSGGVRTLRAHYPGWCFSMKLRPIPRRPNEPDGRRSGERYRTQAPSVHGRRIPS